MKKLTEESPYTEILRKLIYQIQTQTEMEENDLVLIVLLMDTEGKVDRLARWLKTITIEGKINSTPEGIIYEVSMISKMKI